MLEGAEKVIEWASFSQCLTPHLIIDGHLQSITNKVAPIAVNERWGSALSAT